MKNWREVLWLDGSFTGTAGEIEHAYHRLAKFRHPDAGGSHEQMIELNAAKEAALLEVSKPSVQLIVERKHESPIQQNYQQQMNAMCAQATGFSAAMAGGAAQAQGSLNAQYANAAQNGNWFTQLLGHKR